MADIQTALSQAINEWEQQGGTQNTPAKPAPVGVSQATFDFIKNHPAITKSAAIQALKELGYKPSSTTTLISAMVRQGLVHITASKRLNAIAKSYTPIQAGKRLKAKAETASPVKQGIAALPITVSAPVPDPVNHPSHYNVGGIETIDFIEAKQLNYNLGNVVKYITRAEHKGNQLQDLQKAQWYLAREIERVQA
jgi:hypothetical protein